MRRNVTLQGTLVCSNEAEAAVVRRHLPQHVFLTRQEPGCLSFEVEASENPLVFHVAERFVDRAAFQAHQARAAASEWGRAITKIERDYVISEECDGDTTRQ